jgi:hypothetical protein
MKEKFIVITEFPAYRISNFGRIQSRWQRHASYKGFIKKDIWKDLPSFPDAKGYLQIHLCDGRGRVKTERIHTLVALAFLGERPYKNVVRHIDSNPSNNHITNLSYGTYLDNENDKIQNGTWNTRNGGAKIKPQQVLEIRNKAEKGESQKNLALEYGVSRPTITRIINNTIWRK